MQTASVSDLRNNLSAHLKKVAAGHPLVITDHRKPIAIVHPLSMEHIDEHIQSLVAEGLVIPPRKRGKLDARSVLDLPPAKCNARLTEAILEERAEGR